MVRRRVSVTTVVATRRLMALQPACLQRSQITRSNGDYKACASHMLFKPSALARAR